MQDMLTDESIAIGLYKSIFKTFCESACRHNVMEIENDNQMCTHIDKSDH